MNGVPLQFKQEGPVLVAQLTDDLEISIAPLVRQELLRSLTNEDLGLVVDLTDANYIDSAGVNLLFELAEKLQARQLRLAVVVPEGGLTERVLSLVDIDAVASIHRSAEHALGEIRDALESG